MVKACTANWRITRASSTAMMIASAYSRNSDFLRTFAAPLATEADASGRVCKSFMAELFKTDKNASCGTSTLPTCFMRFFPSFCFSSSLRLREMSPP